MVGGAQADVDAMKPVLEAASVTYVGPIGAGHIAKVAKQVVVALIIAAVAAAFTLAQKAGVDPEMVYQAIRGGLAGSAVMDGPMMLHGNTKPGFRIDLHIKDLDNALATSHEVGVPLPLTASVREMMTALAVDGHEASAPASSSRSAILEAVVLRQFLLGSAPAASVSDGEGNEDQRRSDDQRGHVAPAAPIGKTATVADHAEDEAREPCGAEHDPQPEGPERPPGAPRQVGQAVGAQVSQGREVAERHDTDDTGRPHGHAAPTGPDHHGREADCRQQGDLIGDDIGLHPDPAFALVSESGLLEAGHRGEDGATR